MPPFPPHQSVLVVDDCRTVIDLVDSEFCTQPATVHSVNSFAELSDDLMTSASIVFIDQLVDRFDEFMDTLVSLTPRPWIVVTSASRTTAGLLSALRAGASDILLKPFEREDLRNALSRIRIYDLPPTAKSESFGAPVDGIVSSVLHESRNTLQAIQAAIEILEIECSGSVAALQQTKQVEIASDKLSKMLESIEDALNNRSIVSD